MPRATHEQSRHSEELSIDPKAMQTGIVESVRRLLEVCPPEEKKAILASLLAEFASEYHEETEVAIIDERDETIGYFVPAQVPFVTAATKELAGRLQRLVKAPGPTVPSKDVHAKLKSSG